MTEFFADPRRRNLSILAGLAALMSALAVLALWHQDSLLAPKYAPQAYFPGLVQHDREIARIDIESAKFGPFEVAFRPEKGWVLPGMHDYPANFALVRKTIAGMAGLTTIEPKTARPDWLTYLNMRSAKTGRAVEITLRDDHGQVLAQMLAGKSKAIGEPGASGLFVRKPDSNQVWLVRSVFTPQSDPAAWMNKDVLPLAPSQIRSVSVAPFSGPAYVVERASPAEADFHIRDMPKGKVLMYASAPDGPANALTDFSFDKVAPAGTIRFGRAAALVAQTFDGLTITARLTAQDGENWVSFHAEADPASRPAAAQAKAINKAAEGWAFAVPAFKAAQISSPLGNLLKSPGKP